MRSAASTVASRWAITIAVRWDSSVSRSCWRVASVEGSMKAVASSITSTEGLRIATLTTESN